MDIKKRIVSADSFGSADGKQIATELIDAPSQLRPFIADFLGEGTRFRQRAAWVLVELAQIDEQTLYPYIDLLSDSLINSSDDSIKRNILRTFQFIELPQKFHENLINYCFDLLTSKEEAIAIQVFAMNVLYNLIQVYPDLQRELILILEERLPYASAGYKARANKIISAYNKKR